MQRGVAVSEGRNGDLNGRWHKKSQRVGGCLTHWHNDGFSTWGDEGRQSLGTLRATRASGSLAFGLELWKEKLQRSNSALTPPSNDRINRKHELSIGWRVLRVCWSGQGAGGFIGVTMFPAFLARGARSGVEDYVEAIEFVINLIGGRADRRWH